MASLHWETTKDTEDRLKTPNWAQVTEDRPGKIGYDPPVISAGVV